MTLQKHPFDMILSGQKKEEYREIKEYWHSRLVNKDGGFKNITQIEFVNGCSPDSPRFVIQCTGISMGVPVNAWAGGFESTKQVYILKLGKLISYANIDSDRIKRRSV